MSTFSPALAVVPTYNEAPTLHTLVETFERDAPGIDVLVVDDASPDGTGALADRMAATRPWLHVLHRPGKDGLGNAYRAGFAWALESGYAAIAQLDADLSHPPAILPRDARGARARSRPRARLALRTGRRQRRLAAPPPPREPARMRALGAQPSACPTRISRAASSSGASSALVAIDVASTRSQGYVFQVETTQRAHRAGLRIVELPFTFRDRTAGQSKMRASIAFEGVRMVARLRRDGWQPQRVASAARTGA